MKEESPFEAGVCEVDYTPEAGLPLMGNFRNDYAARGVHDRLCARALVFRDRGGMTVALLSVDICMLHAENVAFMRERIFRRAGIPPEHVLVAATHTHSGPAVFQRGGRPGSPPEAMARFLAKAAQAVVLAAKRMRPAELRVGHAREERLAFHRRLLCRDGRTHMNWEKLAPGFVVRPQGPVDPEVIALAVTRGGRPAAVAVNFGLHPAVLAGDNWLYSADFPGYLSEAFSKMCARGRRLCVPYFNGCCGNINHIDHADPLQGRGYQMTQRIGYMLAAAAQEALAGAVAIGAGPIAVSSTIVRARRLKISAKLLNWSAKVLQAEAARKTRGQVDGVPDVFYATIYREMSAVQDQDDRIEVMAIRIGDLAIVGLPGEIFCEFGLKIKKKSPARHTLVIELANGAAGYFPVKQAFRSGGHGATPGTTLYRPGTGEQLADAALGQLKKLF
ncbi:MAG: neutral/alkaline non-lysosomal ceramidase N-terminal domain-containing protein [Kiritimatiellia bacterium]